MSNRIDLRLKTAFREWTVEPSAEFTERARDTARQRRLQAMRRSPWHGAQTFIRDANTRTRNTLAALTVIALIAVPIVFSIGQVDRALYGPTAERVNATPR